jgi:Nucleoside 2-deoxyribosyltransferase
MAGFAAHTNGGPVVPRPVNVGSLLQTEGVLLNPLLIPSSPPRANANHERHRSLLQKDESTRVMPQARRTRHEFAGGVELQIVTRREHGTDPVRDTQSAPVNAEVAAALRAAGHEVFLPQEQEPGKDAAGIFATDVGGIDWADGLVAIVDGADPDAGTSWEVGYAFRKKPIVLVRTDFRSFAGRAGDYSPMLTEAATIRLDLPKSTPAEVAATIIAALGRLET